VQQLSKKRFKSSKVRIFMAFKAAAFFGKFQSFMLYLCSLSLFLKACMNTPVCHKKKNMKHFLIFLALMSMFTSSYSQDSTVIHIWPGSVPGSTAPKHAAKVTANHSGGVTRLSDVTDPVMTMFTPEHPNGAAVVVCPGGGYQILAIDLEGYSIAHWLNQQGFTAFVLQYRVPDKKLGALQDVQRAIRLVRSHAAQWKLDPDQLGVMGFSAGGSLSARISTESDHDWYPPVDKADSLSSKPDFAVLIYPAYLDLGKDHTLTPELKVDKNTPPMFLFQTEDDPYGHSALVMAGALRKAKAPAELHIYPKGGHGYGLRPGNPAASEWPPLAAKWLKNIIKESSH
jgi:acetyl esterase/lipase